MTLNLHKKKILLAEDDGDDRDFFVDFLGDRTDIELLPSVTNGTELINYLNRVSLPEETPDVIILDQNMPKMTGEETLQALKRSGWATRAIIVVYSTYVGGDLTRSCLDLGATLVKIKPVNKEGYHKMMDEILLVCKRVPVS